MLHPKFRRYLKKFKAAKAKTLWELFCFKLAHVGYQEPWEVDMFIYLNNIFSCQKYPLAVYLRNFYSNIKFNLPLIQDNKENVMVHDIRVLELMGLKRYKLRELRSLKKQVLIPLRKLITTEKNPEPKDLKNQVTRNRIRGYRDKGSLPLNPQARAADRIGGERIFKEQEIEPWDLLSSGSLDAVWSYYCSTLDSFLKNREENKRERVRRKVFTLSKIYLYQEQQICLIRSRQRFYE